MLQETAEDPVALPVVVVVPPTSVPMAAAAPVVIIVGGATLQLTCAFGTGLPEASVTFTTSGSKNGRAVFGQPSQINCPFPVTTEIFAAVCADEACGRNRTDNAAKNRIILDFDKLNLQKS
jgi:hypothetical protein